MAKAKKLPSGKWRIQVGYTDWNGKYRRVSFTADTKKEAEYLATEYKIKLQKESKPDNKTLRQIATDYVDSLVNVRSPSTIAGYRKIIQSSLDEDILEARVGFLTKEMYQRAINKYAKNHRTQTVVNVHNVFKNALKWKNINIADNIALPKPQEKEISIPSDEEVHRLLENIEGKRVELLIKFAVFLGLRKSEILALEWKDINLSKKTVSINKAFVKGEDGIYVLKEPKSKAGYRTLTMPDILIDALGKPGKPKDRVINDSPAALESMYKRILRKLDMPYSFHALRHYNASVMLKENIPNKYAQERMGHSTEEMLKRVYQHTFPEKHEEYDEKMNDFFNDFMEDKEKTNKT